MSTVISEEQDMKINIMHALEDFRDAYDVGDAEIVVSEAIANALDVRASTVKMKLDMDLEGNAWLTFHNDGPPMTAEQFERYHTISESTKSKGAGIGFAGIGAKVYLAAWAKTEIHTETSDGTTRMASKMYLGGDGNPKYSRLTPTIGEPGTLYKVRLKPEDFDYLDKNIEDLVVRVFNPAMLSSLEIQIDGKRLKAWRPGCELRKDLVVKSKGRKFPIVLRVTEDEIHEKNRTIQYHVGGKIITRKRPDWLTEVKAGYSGRIHAYVDSLAISDQLNLSKTNFKRGSGPIVGQVMKDVDSQIYKVLKTHGYINDEESARRVTNSLTRFFEKLFKDPKYAFLNPNAKGGQGIRPGSGRGSRGGGSKDGRKHAPENPDVHGQEPRHLRERNTRRGSAGLSITYVSRENDTREGWLDPETSALVVNDAHPLYQKYKNDTLARNQKVAMILTSVLIKNAASNRPMDAKSAFDLQSDLLTRAKDASW